MSVVESGRSSLCGLTLDALLRADKTAPPRLAMQTPLSSHSNHTLLDVMREEHKQGQSGDKTTWKNFIDKLRLKRGGAGWTSVAISFPFPDIAIHNSDGTVQDMNIPNLDSDCQRYNSLGFLLYNSSESTQEPRQPALDLIDRQRNSADISIASFQSPARSPLPQVPCCDPQLTTSVDNEFDQPVVREGRICLGVALAEERARSAREAEVEVSAPAEQPHLLADQPLTQEEQPHPPAEQLDPPAEQPLQPPPEEMQPARMSLMELLDEADSLMEYFDPRYTMDDASDDDATSEKGGTPKGEFSCCVCMIRSKGAAFIPCGHTFCRRCSREIWVQRGSCPLCNSLILEILDIF